MYVLVRYDATIRMYRSVRRYVWSMTYIHTIHMRTHRILHAHYIMYLYRIGKITTWTVKFMLCMYTYRITVPNLNACTKFERNNNKTAFAEVCGGSFIRLQIKFRSEWTNLRKPPHPTRFCEHVSGKKFLGVFCVKKSVINIFDW